MKSFMCLCVDVLYTEDLFLTLYFSTNNMDI